MFLKEVLIYFITVALYVCKLYICNKGEDVGYISLEAVLFQWWCNNRKWPGSNYLLLPKGIPSVGELLDALKFLLASLFPNKPALNFLWGWATYCSISMQHHSQQGRKIHTRRRGNR